MYYIYITNKKIYTYIDLYEKHVYLYSKLLDKWPLPQHAYKWKKTYKT